MIPSPDNVFCLRGSHGPVWYAYVAGRVVGACWATEGAARAGLAVEQRRAAARAARGGAPQLMADVDERRKGEQP